MIPRFSPIIAAWVRSLASSLARMLLTRPFTVSSGTESWAAISLLAFPPAISRRTSISPAFKASSVACSAT
jgi:hypothetical protein